MDVFLFPLATAEGYFRKVFGSVERDRGRLGFPAADGLTELLVVPINQRTADGFVVSEMVTLTHVSPAFEKLSSGLIAGFNRWATLSAFVVGDASPRSLYSGHAKAAIWRRQMTKEPQRSGNRLSRPERRPAVEKLPTRRFPIQREIQKLQQTLDAFNERIAELESEGHRGRAMEILRTNAMDFARQIDELRIDTPHCCD